MISQLSYSIRGEMTVDFSNMDATGLATIIICGFVIVAAIIRFIVHIITKRKDK